MARRPERLAEALREEIAEVVGYELDDPRTETVTVTDVNVSDDLRDAKVFVIVEGTEAEKLAAMKALQHASVFVRQQVALNLSLRHVPLLHFARDTAEENAARVGELLQDLTSKGEFTEKEEISE
ncbi:MAG: 30S ribosome-binding factor RbfA [Blastocatellia bacterium]|jgi:ribosome-binding factor A|nr:30S ribosome-binding factor RbfA [Blastocatellia bacterium]